MSNIVGFWASLGKVLRFLDTYIFGLLGVVTSLFTLWFSMQIKKQVNDSLDIQILKKEQPKLSSKIEELIELVTDEKFKKEHNSQVRGILFQIESNFPVFFENKKNKKIINNLHQCVGPGTCSSSMLHKNLIGLDASLRKAVR